MRKENLVYYAVATLSLWACGGRNPSTKNADTMQTPKLAAPALSSWVELEPGRLGIRFPSPPNVASNGTAVQKATLYKNYPKAFAERMETPPNHEFWALATKTTNYSVISTKPLDGVQIQDPIAHLENAAA